MDLNRSPHVMILAVEPLAITAYGRAQAAADRRPAAATSRSVPESFRVPYSHMLELGRGRVCRS